MKKHSAFLLLYCLTLFVLSAWSQKKNLAQNYPQIIDLSFIPATPTNPEK